MGSPATLTWELDNAVSSLTLDGVTRTALSGSVQAVPVRRQTYTLVAGDGKGRQETSAVEVAAQGMDVLAGNPGGGGCLDGVGTLARLSFPGPVASDAQGNLFFADYYFNVIRKVGVDGTVTTIAGIPGTGGYVDGPAATAQFSTISGLAVASDGTIYVVDHGNGKIRKVAGGQVSTFISLGGGGSGSFLENPAFDGAGNLYVPLDLEGRVAKVSPAGVVTNAATGLIYPCWASLSPSGNLIVVDSFGGLVYQVGSGGSLNQLAFTYAPNDPGGSGALREGVRSVAFDSAGHCYLGTYASLFQVDALNQVTTLAHVDGKQQGSGYLGTIAWSAGGFLWAPKTMMGAVIGKVAAGSPYAVVAGDPSLSGDLDGPGGQALFNAPAGLALDSHGSAYVADQGNFKLKRISNDGTVTTLPIQGAVPRSFMWVDSLGDLYFTDATNRAVSKISGNQSTTVAGGWNSQVGLDALTGIAGDGNGNLYVGDTPWNAGYAVIHKVTYSGQVTSLAGGFPGHSDGQGALASFTVPRGVAFSKGAIYVCDSSNNAIRKVLPDGTVTTFAGVAGAPAGYQDGAGGVARFSDPTSLTADAAGNLFVVDSGNHCIRKVTPDGLVSTVVGSPSRIGTGLGPAAWSLNNPQAVQVTAKGDLLVIDAGAVLLVTAPEGK